VLLLLDLPLTTAIALNAPLQPAGPAVTVLFTDPVPLLAENPRFAAQLLLGLLARPETNTGVNGTELGVTLVVMYLLVSPVDRLS
jgi:predicted component of type VI protein secretion system